MLAHFNEKKHVSVDKCASVSAPCFVRACISTWNNTVHTSHAWKGFSVHLFFFRTVWFTSFWKVKIHNSRMFWLSLQFLQYGISSMWKSARKTSHFKIVTCTQGFPQWLNSCLISALPWQECHWCKISEIQTLFLGSEPLPYSGFLVWEVSYRHLQFLSRQICDLSSSLFLQSVIVKLLCNSA